MKGVLMYLCAVLCLNSPTESTLLEFLHGSLSDAVWFINMTVYMKHFEGRILALYDYERNVFRLDVSNYTDKPQELEFTYNAIYRTYNLLEQCGCDPCDETLMHLQVFGHKGLDTVALWCNNHLFSIVPRIDITNRSKSFMPDEIKELNEVRNVIAVVLGQNQTGCIDRFKFNHIRITFRQLESKLLPSCPRECSFGICNKGQCRMLDVHGPICDCSSTALNGPYCNDSLRVYKREYNNTYDIDESVPIVSFKLSWKRSNKKRYCLLQFVHNDGQETLSIYQSHLLKGSEVLHDIEADGINFLSVKMKKYNLEIKVNHTIVFRKRVFMDKTRINIGFSNAGGNCETFEGQFDLIMSKTGFLHVNGSDREYRKTKDLCFKTQETEVSTRSTLIRRRSIRSTEGRSFLINRHQAKLQKDVEVLTMINWKLICCCLAVVSFIVTVSLSTALIIVRRKLLIANNIRRWNLSVGEFRMLNDQIENPNHNNGLTEQDSLTQGSTI